MCNVVSTGAQVGKGMVLENRMINVGVLNNKLFFRAVRLVQQFAKTGEASGMYLAGVREYASMRVCEYRIMRVLRAWGIEHGEHSSTVMFPPLRLFMNYSSHSDVCLCDQPVSRCCSRFTAT